MIVKSSWAVAVHQLTPVQQYELEHLPAPARTAWQTLAVLGLAVPDPGTEAAGDPED